MMPERVQGWAALPQGESSAARSRETGGAIGCAVLELPGGVRIRFRDQPAAFVAACAVEAGLHSSSSPALQERSTASQASSVPTAASRRRLRRKKSLRRRQEAAAAAAAPASSALQSSSVSFAPRDALSARTSIESEPSASCARAGKCARAGNSVGGGSMDVDGQREAATAAPTALASTEIESPAASSALRDVQCALTPSESEPCAGCTRADVPVGDLEMDIDGQREAATAAPAALASLEVAASVETVCATQWHPFVERVLGRCRRRFHTMVCQGCKNGEGGLGHIYGMSKGKLRFLRVSPSGRWESCLSPEGQADHDQVLRFASSLPW